MNFNCYDQAFVHRLLFAANSLKHRGGEVPSVKEILLEKASASKAAAANLWSNIYNICHMWTKLRSAGSTDGTIPEELVPSLAEGEHIRWNAEQMLTGFRPLTKDEQKSVTDGTASKDALKREQKAHLDICSYTKLKEVDKEVVPYDAELVNSIPGVFKRLQDADCTKVKS